MEIYVGFKYYYDDFYRKGNIINTVVEIRGSDIYVEYYESPRGKIRYATTKGQIEFRAKRYGMVKRIQRGDF